MSERFCSDHSVTKPVEVTSWCSEAVQSGGRLRRFARNAALGLSALAVTGALLAAPQPAQAEPPLTVDEAKAQIAELVGLSQIMLPYMILPLYAVMSRLDPRLTAAARSLGAGPVASFLKVYLPLTLPGVMAGIVLVFTISLVVGIYIAFWDAIFQNLIAFIAG